MFAAARNVYFYEFFTRIDFIIVENSGFSPLPLLSCDASLRQLAVVYGVCLLRQHSYHPASERRRNERQS